MSRLHTSRYHTTSASSTSFHWRLAAKCRSSRCGKLQPTCTDCGKAPQISAERFWESDVNLSQRQSAEVQHCLLPTASDIVLNRPCADHLNDDDDDEIAYFTVHWKTRELVLSTAPETWDNTEKTVRHCCVSLVRIEHSGTVLLVQFLISSIHRPFGLSDFLFPSILPSSILVHKF